MTRPTNDPRVELHDAMTAAGYDRAVIEAIADVALHPRRPPAGQRATDAQVRQVIGAVDVLTTAGRTGAQVLTRLNGFRVAGGDWRHAFWRAELAEANRQWNLRRWLDSA